MSRGQDGEPVSSPQRIGPQSAPVLPFASLGREGGRVLNRGTAPSPADHSQDSAGAAKAFLPNDEFEKKFNVSLLALTSARRSVMAPDTFG